MGSIFQIGIIVRDVEKAAAKFRELMDICQEPVMNRVGRALSDQECGTVYRGDAQSMASCITCTFQMDNVEVEFIQPYGEYPSEWKAFLDTRGEGLHHLGIKIQDVEKTRERFARLGYEEVQSGSWGEGEYHYFDTAGALGFLTEALKFYNE